MKHLKIILIIVIALLLMGAGTLPNYYLSLTTTALIWSIFAISVNFLHGYTGMVSLGQSSFFGFASYVVALFGAKAGGSSLYIFFLAIFLTGILASFLGTMVLRVRGVYFMLLTLAIQQLIWGLAFKWRSLTGGDDGLPGILRPEMPLIGIVLNDPVSFYYFVLLWFAMTAILENLIIHSPVGHSFVGIRENEFRMKVIGYNVWLYRYVVYILSGLLGGMAGTLQAYHTQFVSPNDLGAVNSAKVLLIVILGGSGTFGGPIIGAFLVIFLENLLSAWTDRWLMILGVIYIFVVLVTPKGLMGEVDRWLRRR